MNPLALTDTPVASPHAHGGGSVGRTMRRVQLALVPATLFGFWLYGWPAFFLWSATIAACLGWEALCLRLAGARAVRATLWDGSAALTGWLLAMTLPPWAPWWIAVVGGFVAIVIGKQVFGGLGQNVFNPAMVARVALLVSFPVPMTTWVQPLSVMHAAAPDLLEGLRIFLGLHPVPDAITSATLLGHAKTELARGVDLFAVMGQGGDLVSWTGLRPGSLGESSTLLLAGGGLFLLLGGLISWQVPVAVLAGLAVPAGIAHAIDPGHYLAPEVHLLSGAAMLGAFFIATDYVSSPNTRAGQLIFGFAIGVLAWIIRSFGGYPEGVGFSVLLMNAMTPIIDRYVKPRILGRDRRGRPLDIPAREAS
ncbi:RnfABCDGE type electron transport complex subunit D [Nitrogeniibacter mangrovi]|uniref:Ion-translocating oxidoreductase complex subunit D n=1 Tax=Nitrogeniibacter mangrovi TaxID=2016596 RepID=A0A6C1BAR0_9RHOO|nr:RnfABCDGE type electron transport complex subunit D [Nitrogeniibacter mangrovi]QID19480.1 RnfABCDGE type electron transport complex subunit D [Nitrogeniibacter mangrovi]